MHITISKHKIDLLRELLVVKDFACIVGSSVKNKNPNDVDILIRAKSLDDSLLIQNENVVLPLRKILDPEKDGYLHWINNPQGYHSDAIPLYDLVLRRKEKIQIESVKELVKLDLGCGENKEEGFIGIDKTEYEGVDILYDLNMGIPYPDNSISEVHASHFLEHVWSPDFIMREIHRVLVDGGIFSFVVPSTRGEGAFASPDHTSFWNKSSFAFWSVPELLGSRPQFKIIELQETEYSPEKIDVVGTLEAVKGMSKDKVFKPIMKFIPPKPVAASYTDAYDGSDLWDKWASKMQLPMYVEPKYNSFRSIIQKSGEEVWVSLEDTMGENKVARFGLSSILKDIDADFIIDCAIGIKRDKSWLPRIEMMSLTSKSPKGDIGVVCFDIVYYNKDLHELPFSERRKILEEFYDRYLKHSDVFEISPSYKCDDKKSLFKAISKVSKVDGSEGSMVKTSNGKYSLSGVTNEWGKTKNVLELKVQVHGIQENRNGTFSYQIALLKGNSIYENTCKDDPTLIDLGQTFSTKLKASKGDILTVEIEELIPQGNKLHILGARVTDVDKSRSTPYLAIQAVDMASRSSVLQKDDETRGEIAASFWKNNWHTLYPKSGRGRFCYHHHWRGLSEEDTKFSEDELLLTNHSVHGDIRLETDDKWLWGFSVFLGETANVKDGRDLFRLKDDDKLQGQPKLRQPHEWLTIAHEHPYISPPAGAGSSRLTWSKFFEIDSGYYEMGVWREHSVEIFLHGSLFKGRLLIQFAPVGDKRVWLLSMPNSQIPYAELHDKDEVIREIKSKKQDYLVWAEPKTKPELISTKDFFFRKDAMKQIVYGVVFEPDMVDLQDESVGMNDIEDAAHNYLINHRLTKLSHRENLNAEIVESFIAPFDFNYDGFSIKRGSWIVGMKIIDPKVWQRVLSGEIVGFSPGGVKELL